MKAIFATAAIAAIAGSASAQVSLNEIYASHAGTDDMEFVELFGTPGTSLDGWKLAVFEGQGPAAGTADFVLDLSGNVIPADGYFVIGTTAVPNLDLNVGTDNVFENGTETFVLYSAGLGPTQGTDYDVDDDGAIDIGSIATFGTVADVVAMTDDLVDITYGGPVIGPDGTFFPAGIYRTNDAPNAWDAANFLNFDDSTFFNGVDGATPGITNLPTPGALALMGLAGVAGLRRRR